MEKVKTFPYHISEQPKDKQRINLLLISEDEVNEDTDEGIAENPTKRKKQNISIVRLKILLNYCMVKTANMEEKHTSVIAVYTVLQTKTNS